MKKLTSILLALAMLLSLFVTQAAAAEQEQDPFVVIPFATTETCDPYSQAGWDKALAHSIYDYLFEYDENGKGVPCLVESYELSEDGTYYTFHLRQGVTFHNGHAFDADDVLFSFNYMAGDDYWKSTLLGVVSSMEKVDDYTVLAYKAAPYSSVLNFFCEYMAIVDSEVYTPELYVSNPAGCGAYYVDHIDATTGYTYLNAYEDYWGGAPEVKKIEIRSNLDSNVALIALETGEVDYTLILNETDATIAESEDGINVLRTPSWSASNVLLSGEPMNSDKNLRKAIAYATNADNAAIFSGLVDYSVCEDPWAEMLMGEYAGVTTVVPHYDPELAAQYLADSNYSGETININVYSLREQDAISMQADLAAIGINSQVNIIDTNTWSEMLLNGTIQITIAEMGVAYSSPQEMMGYFVSSGFYGSAGLVATDPEVDAAVALLPTLWDPAELHDATVTALNLFTDNCIAYSLYPCTFVSACNDAYTGEQAVWGATCCPLFKYLTYAD